MALFTHKKKKIAIQRPEVNPQQEVNLINKRINFLMSKNRSISKMTRIHHETTDSEVNLIKEDLVILSQDLKEIRSGIDQARNNFNNAVKELNIRAKVEDMDKLKRIMQEYDPADFISYEEFQRIVEERMNSLRLT
tara:strand:- start:4363 stop:4770 length:408 start_codon:yes stop_codon:yes gene_type:complete